MTAASVDLGDLAAHHQCLASSARMIRRAIASGARSSTRMTPSAALSANRGNMRYSRKESAGEKETTGARDHWGSRIFAICAAAFCRRSSINCNNSSPRMSLSKLKSSAFETIIATILR